MILSDGRRVCVLHKEKGNESDSISIPTHEIILKMFKLKHENEWLISFFTFVSYIKKIFM